MGPGARELHDRARGLPLARGGHAEAIMRVLVTCGSERGGTEGIARTIGETLEKAGHVVVHLPPDEAARARDFDAVIVGGALYANRWHADARRFVRRKEKALRSVPVWFFSSGPLDDSADARVISPTLQVEVLMERVGAQGHVTFGGRLSPAAHGFPASAMAKTRAGDWRNVERIRAWASDVARALPTARPGTVTAQPARSLPRLVLHGAIGWAACAATMAALLAATTLTVALVAHAIVAPLVFAAVARHYFRGRGARDPLPTALAFVAIVALLDLVVVGGLVQRSLVLFTSLVGTWLPFALVFLVTWAVGELMATLPWPKPAPGGDDHHGAGHGDAPHLGAHPAGR
jgi:menaquinone-dependent protoporphyrinogen oxidase